LRAACSVVGVVAGVGGAGGEDVAGRGAGEARDVGWGGVRWAI